MLETVQGAGRRVLHLNIVTNEWYDTTCSEAAASGSLPCTADSPALSPQVDLHLPAPIARSSLAPLSTSASLYGDVAEHGYFAVRAAAIVHPLTKVLVAVMTTMTMMMMMMLITFLCCYGDGHGASGCDDLAHLCYCGGRGGRGGGGGGGGGYGVCHPPGCVQTITRISGMSEAAVNTRDGAAYSRGL